MSFKKHEESRYALDLDLLSILYSSLVSCPRRSGLVGYRNHLKPIYLTCLLVVLHLKPNLGCPRVLEWCIFTSLMEQKNLMQ
jgi:hypothetical protein